MFPCGRGVVLRLDDHGSVMVVNRLRLRRGTALRVGCMRLRAGGGSLLPVWLHPLGPRVLWLCAWHHGLWAGPVAQGRRVVPPHPSWQSKSDRRWFAAATMMIASVLTCGMIKLCRCQRLGGCGGAALSLRTHALLSGPHDASSFVTPVGTQIARPPSRAARRAALLWWRL